MFELTQRKEFSKIVDTGNKELEEWLEAARRLSWSNFKKQISFYVPGFAHYKSSHFESSSKSFPSVSITGASCALACRHCRGKILKTMIPARNPEDLVKVCERLKADGCIGCLVSGGCLPNGSVPVDRFVGALSRIKKNLGLKMVVHTGLIDNGTAQSLRATGVEAALIDIIGSNETIKEIYGLDAGIEDYERSLKALHDSGIRMVPHILVGLHYGEILGEFKAIDMISRYVPSALVVIALTPIKGTPMENTPPPEPEDIAKVLVAARLKMPNVPIALGCVRPLGPHRIRTDVLAIKAGVNAIAFPSGEAIGLATSMGLKTSFHPICCSQVYEET